MAHIIPQTLLESGHAFRLMSIHDVFRKLWREKRRFENARGERTDMVDASINFAVTAWHMTDWAWRMPSVRAAFPMEGKREVERLANFQLHVKQQCRALAACDIIANAAKHGGVAHPRDDRPELETILVAHAAIVEDEEPPAGLTVEMYAAIRADRRWSLQVSIDGRRTPARGLFNEAFRFWDRFIQGHCISHASDDSKS
jgi:hypothetical protein